MDIDYQILTAEISQLRESQKNMLRQNKLLKQEVQQLKLRENNLQNELKLYKKVVLNNQDSRQILELQHSRIFQLQTKVEVLGGNDKKNSYSAQETNYAIKCRQYERKIKQMQTNHQRQISQIRDKLQRYNAMEIVESMKNSKKLPSMSKNLNKYL